MAASEIKALIDEVQELAGRLAGAANKPEPTLHGAPSEAAIAAYSGFDDLPPSFQEFLRLHNGWDLLWSGFSILGVDGQRTKAIIDDINVTVDEEVFALEGRENPDPAKYLQREAERPDYAFLPNHTIFGTDFNGQILLFDSRTRDGSGEMNVVVWSSGGDVVERFQGFVGFLESVAKTLRQRLDKV